MNKDDFIMVDLGNGQRMRLEVHSLSVQPPGYARDEPPRERPTKGLSFTVETVDLGMMYEGVVPLTVHLEAEVGELGIPMPFGDQLEAFQLFMLIRTLHALSSGEL